MTRDRKGFTLVELIVVAVLGSMLLMVIVQTLLTNQRTYTAQGAKIQGQQALRSAVDVLFNEIREISAQGGDIVSMSSSQITVRSMRKFGVVCSVTSASPPVLRVTQVGEWFEVGDSVFAFADNLTSIASDDDWIPARITAVDTTANCGASRAQNLSFTGQAALFTADSVRVGAPVRSYVRYTYGLMSFAGKSYLGRTGSSGATAPMVGPLEASTGLRFAYLDSLGATTTVAGDVRQVRITVRTSADVMNSVGRMISDSITVLAYTRN